EESAAAAQKVSAQIPVRFVDVTKEAALPVSASRSSSNAFGPGACFLDYDNDGKVDLFLPRPPEGMGLYHNIGNGKFQEVTKQAGVTSAADTVSCTVGDYDNDGYADLATISDSQLFLLHNNKNGTFTDVTKTAGISNQHYPMGTTFIDYDHDGDLDLYVTELPDKL